MRLLILSFTLVNFCLAANVSRTVRLNNGVECPIVGLGTGGYRAGGPPQDKVVMQMIADAIELGYRHIDTASSYFNEEAIGKAVNVAISEGKVKRSEMFITTKIFGKSDGGTRGRDEAIDGVNVALKKLNTSYIDLMLIHRPDSDSKLNAEMWSGLEEALTKGLVRAIGVSNFNTTQLDELLKTAKVVPSMNQVESHPQMNQDQLISYCTKHGIRVTAYSPLGAGTLITDPTIASIGKKHNKSAAQVMLRYQIQRGVVVIPKSTQKKYIKENIDIFDFELTDNEMTVLDKMK